MHEVNDELMGHVDWGDNRAVVVFQRTYGGDRFVRMRTFQRHKGNGIWYPGPRGFQVGQDVAEELGMIISRAGQDQVSGPPPDWWAGFEAQYEGRGKVKSGKRKKNSELQVST